MRGASAKSASRMPNSVNVLPQANHNLWPTGIRKCVLVFEKICVEAITGVTTQDGWMDGV